MSMARASWRVVRGNRRLLILPLVSALAAFVVAAALMIPAVVLAGASGR
jgi:hypothetical protein